MRYGKLFRFRSESVETETDRLLLHEEERGEEGVLEHVCVEDRSRTAGDRVRDRSGFEVEIRFRLLVRYATSDQSHDTGCSQKAYLYDTKGTGSVFVAQN